MATTTKSKAAAKTSRYNELKKMLEHRRRELMNEVQGKIRDVRAEGSKDREVLDQGESSEVDIQEDIEFALIQMKSETLSKINEALRRLDESTTATASSAATRSPRRVSGRCRSPCAARIARRRARRPSSASACSRSGAARRRSSSTCRTDSGAAGSAELRRLGRQFRPVGRRRSAGSPRQSVARAEWSPPAGSHLMPPARSSHGTPHHELKLTRPSIWRNCRRATGRSRSPTSCRFCRFGTRCCSRTPSCRSPWRARAPCG